MAQQTNVVYVDDLEGKEITDNDVPTVHFSLDGVDYEIDLNNKNQEKMRKALKPYVDAAHRVGKKTGKRGTKTSSLNASEVRAWAQQQGLEVPDRGRLPQHIMDAWNAR